MAFDKASYDKVNAAMGDIAANYGALQLAKVTVQETGQQFSPPAALKTIWQQNIDAAKAIIKAEVATW
jgi:hypothetical protein